MVIEYALSVLHRAAVSLLPAALNLISPLQTTHSLHDLDCFSFFLSLSLSLSLSPSLSLSLFLSLSLYLSISHLLWRQ